MRFLGIPTDDINDNVIPLGHGGFEERASIAFLPITVLLFVKTSSRIFSLYSSSDILRNHFILG